jgi:hypothetical protein
MKAMIAKKLPFYSFDDHAMVYQDGSFGVGFKLAGADISVSHPDHINAICQKIENLLVGLPERIKVQLFYRLTDNVEGLLRVHKEVSAGSDNTYEPIRNARMGFLESKRNDGLFFVPETYLFLRSAPLEMRRRRFFEKEQEFQGFPEKEFLAAKERFFILVSQVESALRAIQVGPARLVREEWFDLVFSYLNFERSRNLGVPSLRNPLEPLAPSLPEQLALTDWWR